MTDSVSIFTLCDELVGGNGTKCDETYPSDKTCARIDDLDNGRPGYFTAK